MADRVNMFSIVMKTSPPWVDYNNNKTYLGLFRDELSTQIKYAHIAIGHIENFKGEYTYHLFFGVQGLLCALANISKLLDDKVKRNARANNRARKLLLDFQIDADKIPLIMNRDLRNTSEHYDERLDEFIEKFPNHLYFDSISAPGISVQGAQYKIGRFYNKKTKTIQFMDSTITKVNDLKIDKVKAELQYLEMQIKQEATPNE